MEKSEPRMTLIKTDNADEERKKGKKKELTDKDFSFFIVSSFLAS